MRTLLLSIALFLTTTLLGQVTIKLQAPRQAEVGEKIRISYVVNTNEVDDFEVSEFPGFRVLYGPSTSTQSSFSMVNGKTTRSSSVTYTYLVQPTEEGVLDVPAGVASVDGKTYTSKTGRIEVLPSSSASSSSAANANSGSAHSKGRGEPQDESASGTTNAAIGDKDLYIDLVATKTKVYEQEAVLLTYKLYTLVNIQQLTGEMPELDGFHVQEVGSKAQMSLKYERVNGRNYGTAVWRQYVLYPQRTGKMTVPSINFDALVEFHNTSMDPFDIFFGGGSLTQTVKKQIKTPALELDVKALPTPRPENFNGAVGNYTFSGTLTPQSLKSNDAATLRLVVSGHGNMHLMKSPVVKFPKDFEVYDPKKEDKTAHSAQGAKGTVTYDYVVVPRHGGTYDIPPVEFCYFDPDKQEYQVLKTEPYHVEVAKSANEGSSQTYTSKEDLKVIGNDIRFIKLGSVDVDSEDSTFFDSKLYWTPYVFLFLIFAVLLIIFRRYVKENANNARRRGKKAGKAANQRLRNAEKLMKAHDSAAFYDEIMRALLGYAGDKLNLHTTDLNKDNVRQALTARGVEATLIDSYLDVVSQCEFARFAPGDPDATMDRIYTEADEAINKLNAILK